jgi:hypothetical protein
MTKTVRKTAKRRIYDKAARRSAAHRLHKLEVNLTVLEHLAPNPLFYLAAGQEAGYKRALANHTKRVKWYRREIKKLKKKVRGR